MACKTGGTGLNNVFTQFGNNQDRVFIMAYAPEFSGEVIQSSYDQLGIELLFPLIGNDGAAQTINTEIGRSWFAGGWLLHPDGHKEEVGYKEDVLAAKLTEALADSCAELPTGAHFGAVNESTTRTLSVHATNSGLSFTAAPGDYQLSLFTLGGRGASRFTIHSSGGTCDTETGAVAAGTYALRLSGPAGSYAGRIVIAPDGH